MRYVVVLIAVIATPALSAMGAEEESASTTALAPMAIDELESLDINGARQWVLYRSADQSNPVVLFVHGGPGYPQMWYARAFDDALLDDFVIVHWDQRGAGKSASNDVPSETITLAQIADDGLKLTAHLKQKFDTSQIILVGHSWGTLVAANMVQKSPDDFHSLILVGTCANWKRGEELRYAQLKQLAKEQNDRDVIKEVALLGPPPYTTARQIETFGGLVYKLEGFSGVSRKLREEEFAKAIEQSPEYSEQETKCAVDAITFNLDLLGEFCNTYVLQEAVPRLEVPVYFAQGEFDTNTPTVLAKEYFEQLEAPKGKQWILFKDAAHFAMYEDRQKFLQVLKSATKHEPVEIRRE